MANEINTLSHTQLQSAEDIEQKIFDTAQREAGTLIPPLLPPPTPGEQWRVQDPLGSDDEVILNHYQAKANVTTALKEASKDSLQNVGYMHNTLRTIDVAIATRRSFLRQHPPKP